MRLCRNGLHEMTPENTMKTTDGAERCKACRREQARKRKLREEAQGEALMDLREVERPDTNTDFQLPLGTLGRKWMKEGKCAVEKMDRNWFFSPLLEDETSTFCEGCPVINLCFAYAVIGGEQGVWGGTTEAQRSLLSLAQRLTIRQSYAKMYSDYLGEAAEPSERVDVGPPAMPFIPEWREDTILRGIEATDYAGALGLGGGTDKNRYGNQGGKDGVQS